MSKVFAILLRSVLVIFAVVIGFVLAYDSCHEKDATCSREITGDGSHRNLSLKIQGISEQCDTVIIETLPQPLYIPEIASGISTGPPSVQRMLFGTRDVESPTQLADPQTVLLYIPSQQHSQTHDEKNSPTTGGSECEMSIWLRVYLRYGMAQLSTQPRDTWALEPPQVFTRCHSSDPHLKRTSANVLRMGLPTACQQQDADASSCVAALATEWTLDSQCKFESVPIPTFPIGALEDLRIVSVGTLTVTLLCGAWVFCTLSAHRQDDVETTVE
eukprot:m.985349 g.985349  ORF g.985349 m.985349 type:complete len:273 (-) comp23982_c2_seq11:136-954(-)